MILNCFIQEANLKFLLRNLKNSKGGKFPENKKGTIGKVCHIFCFVSNLNWLGRGGGGLKQSAWTLIICSCWWNSQVSTTVNQNKKSYLTVTALH